MADKKKKSSSWDMPGRFRRRGTLERGRHQSTPALQAKHASYEDEVASKVEIAVVRNEGEQLKSPLRSEFSDESGGEGEDRGKLGKLVRKVKRRFHTKKASSKNEAVIMYTKD
jgi:hypothetical protein